MSGETNFAETTLRDRMAIARLLADHIAHHAPVNSIQAHNRWVAETAEGDTRFPLVKNTVTDDVGWVARCKLLRYDEDEAPGLEGSGRMANQAAFLVGVGDTAAIARDDLRDQILRAARRMVR